VTVMCRSTQRARIRRTAACTPTNPGGLTLDAARPARLDRYVDAFCHDQSAPSNQSSVRSPGWSYHLVDDEDVVDPARHAVRLPGAGIPTRVAIFVDPPHAGRGIRDDLLASDDQDGVCRT